MRNRSEARRRLLSSSLPVMLGVWTILLLGYLAAQWLGEEWAILISFLAATALVMGTRPRSKAPGRNRFVPLAASLLAFAAGYASLSVWSVPVREIGPALGLDPSPGVRPGAGGPVLWIAILLLAPLFEELLYRERLLRDLRPLVGVPLATLLSSACFALPHFLPWAMLGAFVVGLLLGVVLLTGRSVALCIGFHAGLNLATVLCGVPAIRFALPVPAAALVTVVALAAGLWIVGRKRPTGSRAEKGKPRLQPLPATEIARTA